ncbi:MAG: [protein-PII] uridylyltransferase [Neisseria sp.]|nr:[protein-PII] uridylyltransferase [Neisseria sp.]
MNTLLSSLEHDLHHGKAQWIARYRSTRRVHDFFAGYDTLLHDVLGRLWRAFFDDTSMVLLAIGGFGRGEMYPFSDLDIAIVLNDAPDAAQQERIAAFVQSLWDLGLHPAPKIGTHEELCAAAQEDLSGDTALLEARVVCGNTAAGERLLRALTLQRDVATFIDSKISEQEQRHAKAQGSGSLLEPNLKSGPGGLRDIHTMIWLAKAQGISPSFPDLVAQDILTRHEARLLVRAHRILARIRIELHLSANRAEERLLFDYQTKVAAGMGLPDDAASLKSEKLMKMFYRATKVVKQLSGILLPMLKGRVSSSVPRRVYRIDENYYQVGNLIAVADKTLFKRDQTQIFHILMLMQHNPDTVGIAPQTLRAWWSAGQNIDESFYRNAINRRYFLDFFKQPEGLTHVLRMLNLYGILGKYLPAFDRIVGLLQHDLFHIYPVDDHILMVVRNMRRLAMEEFSHELPFAAALMYNFEKKYILYLAAFFHDIAKGRGGDHALLGAQDARVFAHDHFLSSEDGEWIAWLVEHHLLLSLTAQKEDIQEPEVIAHFCETVNTPHKLIALYLLTVADVRGTNPAIWSTWKAGLFEHLFQAALAHLQGKSHDKSVLVGRRRQLAQDIAHKLKLPESAQKKLWQMLGDAYFVRHDSVEIRWHLQEIAASPETPHAALRLQADNMLQVMVYMPNRPLLFAGICQIFSRFLFDIVRARAYVTAHDFILDTFELYAPPQFDRQDLARTSRELLLQLSAFAAGKVEPIQALTMPKSRRSRHLPIIPKISIVAEDDSDQGHYFTLHVVTHNRTGLLANIAGVLSDFGISIRHARINTLGDRVEDSFSLYAPQLADAKNQIALKKALLQRIEE